MLGSSHRSQVTLLPLLLLLTAPLVMPIAGAQLPSTEGQRLYGVSVEAERSSVFVDYLGNQVINLTLEDVSEPSAADLTAPVGNKILLDVSVVGQPRGWVASLGFYSLSSAPGQTHRVPMNIQAGATIEDPRVDIQLDVRYIGPEGEAQHYNLTFLAIAKPNPFLNLQLGGLPDRFQPDERQRVAVTIQNQNYYPDMVFFEVSAPEGWIASPPSSITLAPGEERTVYIDVKAPQDPWFRLNPRSETILVTAISSTSPSARYTVGVPAPISGWFLPGWVIPHIALLFLGAAVMIGHRKRAREEKRLEKGKPHYPGLPPEDEARLVALKKTDRAKASEMEDRLQTVHIKRKEAWKDRYKKRRELEKKLAKREKERHDAVLAAQKEKEKADEERRKREKQRLEEEKRKREQKLKELTKKKAKARKRQEKAQKREEKRLQKEMQGEAKRKQKELEKLKRRKAKLEKQRAKERKKKEKRLEKLRKRKAKLEDESSDDESSPWWKPWG